MDLFPVVFDGDGLPSTMMSPTFQVHKTTQLVQILRRDTDATRLGSFLQQSTARPMVHLSNDGAVTCLSVMTSTVTLSVFHRNESRQLVIHSAAFIRYWPSKWRVTFFIFGDRTPFPSISFIFLRISAL